MIFNNLQRFNNTLTLMINQFNKYREASSDLCVMDNKGGISNPASPGDIHVTVSAIASALYGHFVTNNVRSGAGLSRLV
jgi:hypothetical protein